MIEKDDQGMLQYDILVGKYALHHLDKAKNRLDSLPPNYESGNKSSLRSYYKAEIDESQTLLDDLEQKNEDFVLNLFIFDENHQMIEDHSAEIMGEAEELEETDQLDQSTELDNSSVRKKEMFDRLEVSIPKTKNARQKANRQAIEILEQLENGTLTIEQLTPAHKTILAQYSGNGGGLIGRDGKKGSDYEYYTPTVLAQGMWELVQSLGFKGGKVLLKPNLCKELARLDELMLVKGKIGGVQRLYSHYIPQVRTYLNPQTPYKFYDDSYNRTFTKLDGFSLQYLITDGDKIYNWSTLQSPLMNYYRQHLAQAGISYQTDERSKDYYQIPMQMIPFNSDGEDPRLAVEFFLGLCKMNHLLLTFEDYQILIGDLKCYFNWEGWMIEQLVDMEAIKQLAQQYIQDVQAKRVELMGVDELAKMAKTWIEQNQKIAHDPDIFALGGSLRNELNIWDIQEIRGLKSPLIAIPDQDQNQNQ